jgi:hypothetical protein
MPADSTKRFAQPPVVMRYDGIDVVREDLLEGGSKTRFLPYLIEGAKEVVYGGPFCGAAALALSVLGRRLNIKVTLFYASRKPRNWHGNQRAAQRNGATIYLVPTGYMTNVQAKAKAYARERGALFLPLGFDVPQATEPYIEVLRKVAPSPGLARADLVHHGLGDARALSRRRLSRVTGDRVCVGLASRHDKQAFTPNVRLIDSGYSFSAPARTQPPFPSRPEYDARRGSYASGNARAGRFSGMFCEEEGTLRMKFVPSTAKKGVYLIPQVRTPQERRRHEID